MVIEERSERLRKLHLIQKKYNIQLKTKITETGEEIICLEIPFDQKVRNECNDYHYFFTFKKDRCPILQDKNRTGRQFDTGFVARLIEDFNAVDAVQSKHLERELRR